MAAALGTWRPTVGDVARLVPTRTLAADGTDTGTFGATTKPTATQVEGLIRGVQSEVVALVGAMPERLAEVPVGGTIGDSPAGHVVALGTAALVESQFYPDPAAGGDASSTLLDRRYSAALKGLAKAANDISAGGDPGDAVYPAATFPDTVARGLATSSFETW